MENKLIFFYPLDNDCGYDSNDFSKDEEPEAIIHKMAYMKMSGEPVLAYGNVDDMHDMWFVEQLWSGKRPACCVTEGKVDDFFKECEELAKAKDEPVGYDEIYDRLVLAGMDMDIELLKKTDSMLWDSGIEVANAKLYDEHTGRFYTVSLRVCGDVRVHQYDTSGTRSTYKHASDMPDGLLAKIADGTYGKDSNIDVIDNNWFEVFVYDDEDEVIYNEVVDINFSGGEGFVENCKGYIAEAIE